MITAGHVISFHSLVGIISAVVYHFYGFYLLNFVNYTIISTIYSILLFVIAYGLARFFDKDGDKQGIVMVFFSAGCVGILALLLGFRYMTGILISLCVTLFPHLSLSEFIVEFIKNLL